MAVKDQFGSIAAGELRRRVKFQMPFESQDATGASLITWETQLSCWARVEPLTGNELYAAQQMYPEVSTQITLRGALASKLDPKMRMVYAGMFFDILAIMDIDERHVEAKIMAVQRPAERASK